MTCPKCRLAIEETENIFQPSHTPQNGHWFVCTGCAGISRFRIVAGVTVLCVPTVDDLADIADGGQRAWLIVQRQFIRKMLAER